MCAFNLVDTCQVGLCSKLHLHWLPPRRLQNVSFPPLRPHMAIQCATRNREKVLCEGLCVVQEVLRKHNEPKRDTAREDAPPASLWHAMQQRQRPSSSSSEEAEQGTPASHSAWRDDSTGDLFDSGYAPGRAATWHVSEPAATALHAPVQEQTQQAAVLGERKYEGDAMGEDVPAAGPIAANAASRSRRTIGLVPEGSETSNSMMGNLMNTMRR